MGVHGQWGRQEEPWNDVKPLDQSDIKARVASKLLKVLQKTVGEYAPTGIEVASNSDDHVLFNLHYQGNARDGHTHINHGWVLLTFELGGHQSTCIPHGNDLIQASMTGGTTLEKLERALDNKMLSSPRERF